MMKTSGNGSIAESVKDTADRISAEFEKPKGLTLQYCAIEVYETSEYYNGKSGEEIIEKIVSSADDKGYSYCIMKHDNDFYTENTFDSNHRLIGKKGMKKENHWHVVLGLKYRLPLSDVALWFGIPDRFIKKLKSEKDFDNMLVYLTHIKYHQDIKTHYDPSLCVSNIEEYFMFLYDNALKQIEENEINVATYVISYLQDVKHKVDYRKIIPDLLLEYQINDILKYFRIIEKLVQEHNQQFDIDIQHEKATDMIKMLENRVVELQQNFEAVINENMELRGIGPLDDKERIFE